MEVPEHERAISFRFGEAFPANEPVAAFIVAISLAWKDLLYVNMRLLGGDEQARYHMSDGELRYLGAVAFAHLQEMRICINQARAKWPEVATFLDGLPAETQSDLRQVLDLNTTEHGWIEPALRYVRNQTFHYGGKTNWKDVRWAMRAVKEEEGVVSRASDTYAGTRLDFAEMISVQHLTRKFPPAESNSDDEALQEQQQMRTLVQALTTAINAAIRFAMGALGVYLRALPTGIVNWEPLASTPPPT